ncbi:tRNA-specific 2-thiouridylase MnmA [Nitzschia inconspicua]|uniref:tRNA-specific 2-thiouridylase MnmA n=1 Tax=Nitzschia inconspicua TaxID=303405 RepID=A0A9K3LT95_9STRA|nr:tRNA-specific 2-thiouridylase MnmA [Nitzschia inconspicua]
MEQPTASTVPDLATKPTNKRSTTTTTLKLKRRLWHIVVDTVQHSGIAFAVLLLFSFSFFGDHRHFFCHSFVLSSFRLTHTSTISSSATTAATPFVTTTQWSFLYRQQQKQQHYLSFVPSNGRQSRQKQDRFPFSIQLSVTDDDMEDYHNEPNHSSSNNNSINNNNNNNNNDSDSNMVESIQKRILQSGLSWNQTFDSNMSRVPGCVATVHILATATRRMDDDNDDDNNNHTDDSKCVSVVDLKGNADAIFSRGLLHLLQDFLYNTTTVTDILQMDPRTIADRLGVRPALSQGRNDGLANMMTIVQQQLQQQQQQQNPPLNQVSNVATKNTTRHNQISTAAPPTVALLLSGGVDSSVALHLLLQQGYTVVPYYLKIWLEDELAHLGTCPWEDDVETCRLVCDQAGVELQIVSLQEEYHRRVMQHTLHEASLGRTPNPDILCNSRVKFGCFLEYLESGNSEYQFDYIASGHYAQIQRLSQPQMGADDGTVTDGPPQQPQTRSSVRLYRAPDPVKDQSYFLCALEQRQLRRLLFPIGHLEKSQVRELAEEFQLPNRNRPDSQGLCFLGKIKFRDFLQSHLGVSTGDIVDAVTGEIVGTHRGVWYHTVGQRKGIGPYLKPTATAFGPWFVVAKDPSKNIVYASNRYEEHVFDEARSKFHVENVHWISGTPPTHLSSVSSTDHNDDDDDDDENDDENGTKDGTVYNLQMKIRHGPKLTSGKLKLVDNVKDEGTVELKDKDGGLAPGQYVVFYGEDGECLGGGIISERHWTRFLQTSLQQQQQQQQQQEPLTTPIQNNNTDTSTNRIQQQQQQQY